MKKISFIGGGNMAFAMVEGLLKTRTVDPRDICVSDPDPVRLALFKHITAVSDNQKAAGFADVIFLAVKPQLYGQVLAGLDLQNKLLVTLAPGVTTGYLSAYTPRVVRAMPNMPALVETGVTAVCRGEAVTDREFSFVKGLLRAFSAVYELSEEQMDAAVPLSGSSPAYFYLMLDAMAAQGARMGVPYDTALKMAAQSACGAALMVLETAESPADLARKVMSPGGATEKAVEKLKELRFAETVAAAMDACLARARELKK